MKVFIVNTVYGYSSTGRIAVAIKHTAEGEGHECFAAYGRGHSEEANTLCVSSRIDLYRHALLTRLTDRHALYSKNSTLRLIAKIREFSPDIVHLHNLHGYYLHIGMLFDFLREYAHPVVWTLHDCWSFTGHCAHFDYVGCQKWKTGCHDCSQGTEYPASWRRDASAQNFRMKKRLFSALPEMVVVTPSRWLAGLARESFLARYDVRVIPNGIDLAAFRPTDSLIRARYGLENQKIALGVASPWRSRKGFLDFQKLPALLGDGWKVVMVGLDDRQMRSLPKEIVGIGRVDGIGELAQFYAAADVFVNASCEETLPTVNIEALACGTPVVTYASGGSSETIDPSCGTSVARGDVSALAEAIRAADFSRSACVRRAARFDGTARCREYVNLYQEILDGGMAGGRKTAVR